MIATSSSVTGLEASNGTPAAANGAVGAGASSVPRAAVKLPPSVRDFQIYRFVKFECNSTREAAHEFDLSQTRVRQVLARVAEWFTASVALEDGDDPRQARLVGAERLAREQLEFLYQRAVMAFDATQREDVHGNLLPGKIAYLALAGRIVMWMSKVPLHAPAEFGEHEEELNEDTREPVDPNDPELVAYGQRVLADLAARKAESEALREEVRLKVEREHEQCRQRGRARVEEHLARRGIRVPGVNPPSAECSPGAVSSGDSGAAASRNGAASVPEEGTYRTLDEIKAEARREFLRPAQRADAAERDIPQAGSDDRSDDHRPLTRKERRARQRKLERLTAKR